ncbi:multicopper oxidase [hydrocarbon metagenome]|uniref:Multicopper oxidase n=1 Tax=hydrocarbon metagenome TaxID=938273 RepID=A0A0W8FZQ3_9ZZZZ
MKIILKIWLINLILFGIFSSINAQNSLYIINPQWGWWGEPGIIEEATLTIRPKGVFFEYGLYLTFSADQTYFDPSDSLEVELKFNLHNNAFVHDSWLWIEDEIIQAEIMDEWTAGQIYNEIVGRNLDPSILFKRDGYYELRVFPIMKGMPRKVKITYMVPTNWTSNLVTAPLPVEILRTSASQVENLKLVVYPSEKWDNPGILEYNDLDFESEIDTVFGEYKSVVIPKEYLRNSLTFSLNSPMESGFYLSTFTETNEDYYQLAVLPSEILTTEASNNIMVLFDYESPNSSLNKTEILNGVKLALLNYLSDSDSFNIAFSKLNIERISEDWLPADSATIENTFQNITTANLSNYSNLPSLIGNAIDFINSHSPKGIILIVSNSDELMNPESANELIDDIVDAIESDITFHVADFQNQNINYIYIGNQYYEGNQYFYNNITRMTGGNFYRIRDGYTYPALLEKTFQGVGGFISTFDLYTSLVGGFCYGRYNINLTGSSAFLDAPIFQVGKFNGSPPFRIEMNGVYEGTVFSKNFEIDEDKIDNSDTTLIKMWVSRYIKELEAQGSSSNNIMSEIINTSIANRVLSKHTAFICLEPSLGGQVCYDCRDDGGGSTDVETDDSTNINDDFTLAAYPNPFNNQTKIQINLPSSLSSESISFKIYNILGQVVKTFEIDQSMRGKFELVWDGRNDYGQNVSSGIYIFVAITPQKTHSVKLQLIK